MSIKHLGGCPRTLWFLRLPRQTGHRVFPSTAFRRPSPFAYQQPLSLIHSFEPLTRSYVPARRCFSASSLATCRRLFHFTGQFRSRAWIPQRVYSIAATRTAHSRILPSSRHLVEARPYARDGLCCSVRHHFRAAPTSPAPVTHLLPVSPNLRHAYCRWSPTETRGSQVRSPVIFPCMLLTLPRVPDWCKCPLLPNRQWPSPHT